MLKGDVAAGGSQESRKLFLHEYAGLSTLSLYIRSLGVISRG